MKKIIPIFFATNNNYAPYLSIALISMLENGSKDYFYKIHILSASLSNENKNLLKKCITQNSSIEFISLQDKLTRFQSMFHTRDYYSKETYYRFFISNLYPEYDKVIYLDADMVILGDVSELYNLDMNNYLVAAVHEDVMDQPIFGDYSEKTLGVPREDYFNAGMLVINTDNFRKQRIEEKFIHLLNKFTFTVAQDQDYLNILCQNQVKRLDMGWNKASCYEPKFNNDNLKIIHYKLNHKPWHYDNVEYELYFWKYAKICPFYPQILKTKETYSEEEKKRDSIQSQKMAEQAIRDSINPSNYWNYMSMGMERYALVRGIQRVYKVPINGTKKLSKYINSSSKKLTKYIKNKARSVYGSRKK